MMIDKKFTQAYLNDLQDEGFPKEETPQIDETEQLLDTKDKYVNNGIITLDDLRKGVIPGDNVMIEYKNQLGSPIQLSIKLLKNIVKSSDFVDIQSFISGLRESGQEELAEILEYLMDKH
jgi:hypothetical protein